MAVTEEMINIYNSKIFGMSDKDLIHEYLKVRQSGFNFEKETALEEVLWRMGYGREGVGFERKGVK